MEKGTLLILPTKKGFAAKIQYPKQSGSQGEMIVTSFKPTKEHANKYHEKPCQFLRDKGSLVLLIAEDGSYLVGTAVEKGQYKAQDASSVKSSESSHNWGPDSFDATKTRLPSDTRDVLRKIGTPDNFALKFSKATRYEDGKFSFFRQNKKGNGYFIQAAYGDTPFDFLVKRSELQAKSLFKANNVVAATYKIDWRLIQGLGVESVYEVSLTLHPIYGIPYIPASVVKGIVRSWIIVNAFAENNTPSEARALANKDFCDVFGCPKDSHYKEARKGNVTFFDAFPLSAPQIIADVVSPHYGEYYSDPSGRIAPADHLKVVPVPFLAVTNTSFHFLMASHELSYIKSRQIEGKTLSEWFEDALLNHGIGAKTSLGYGLMTVHSDAH